MAVKAMRVLGFMTGTSLDAVDMAVIETDGTRLIGFGPAGETKLDPSTRAVLESAMTAARGWTWGAPAPPIFAVADLEIARVHERAARRFMADHSLARDALDLIGFHGQTVLHDPPRPGRPGRTVQLGDGTYLARALGVPVAYDFRTADVAAGGQGAPLAPVYHRARAAASGLTGPLAVLNLGGVGNITFIAEDSSLIAFDTGPANGMIDQLVQARTGERCDWNGALAAGGRIVTEIVNTYLGHDYFQAVGPKSLDRFDFSLDPIADLTLSDAAATLTAFAARSAAIGLARCPVPPSQVIVCGGGRHNPVLLGQITDQSNIPVVAAEAVGWRGDAIEAEAFAFLAARTRLGLPLSFPLTTGVPSPWPGGRVAMP